MRDIQPNGSRAEYYVLLAAQNRERGSTQSCRFTLPPDLYPFFLLFLPLPLHLQTATLSIAIRVSSISSSVDQPSYLLTYLPTSR